MFRTRLLSGIVLVAVAAGTIIAGGLILAAVLCIISLIAYRELTKATGVHDGGKRVNGLELTGFLMTVAYYAGLYIGLLRMNEDGIALVYRVFVTVVVVAVLIFMFVYVFSFPRFQAGQVMAAFFELIYAPFLLSSLYIIREGWEQGALLTVLVFLCSWGSDTCAYVVGVLFGKHKMAPKLSPKKSVEGGIGGVAGAALLGVLFALAMNHWGGADVNPLHYAVICGAGGMISQVGDLAASAVKRNHDIKDYGTLIPGHGGILDRFDSVIFTAPVIYYLAILLAGNI